MLLAIDVGNTNSTFAVFKNDEILANWRLGTTAWRTGDEHAGLLSPLFAQAQIAFGDIDGVVISSVVPPTLDALAVFCRKYLSVTRPVILSSETDIGMPLKYRPVGDIGADRLANAVCASEKYGVPVIIVDFGTATTLDAVNRDGEYIGGAIAPGIQISLDALFSRAARLMGVSLDAPENAIGQSTAESLQSGIIYGFAGQVDALARRFVGELGADTRVVATGGLAHVIADHSETIELCDDLLTLEGLRIIHERVNGK